MELIGRLGPAAEVLEAVRGGRSVLLLGAGGSGRSHLLGEVADRLAEEGRDVGLVRGRDGEAGVPLVAVAALVAEHGLAGAEPLTVYTRLPAVLGRRRTILLVDDVGALDRASAVLLGQVVRAGGTAVMIGESADDLPGSVHDELVRRGAATVWLEPLAPDDVLAMAAALAGDELASESAADLLALAEGSPALVVDLVAAADITVDSTGACLSVMRPGPRSRRVVAGRAALPESALRAFVEVALAERLPTILLDEEGVAHLRQAGLVAGSDVSTVVRRLDAMVLLDDVPPDELSARRRALGGRLRAWAGWQARADLLTLRGGGTVPTHQLVQSVDRSLADGRVTDAGELLHALPPMDDPAVLLLQGRVCSELGRLDEALAHLQAVLATAQADSVLGCVGRELGLLHAVRRMDPGAAVASVEGVLSRMVDPGERRVLAADLVKWRLMAGQPVDRGEPDEGDARAVVMARTRLTESLIGAMLAALDGTRSAVQDHVDAGFALLADVPDVEPWVAELLTLSQYLGLAFDGDVDTAEALAAQHRDRAASAAAPSLGMWEYAAAETALHRGVTRQAAALARRAVRHLAWRDYTGLRPTAAALVAAVDARCGRLTSAERQVDQIPAAQLLDVKVELHVARVRAERRLRERDVPGAAQILDDVGRRAAASAHRHLGVMAVDEAMMIDPRESRRELLVELIGDSGSELGDALAGRAAALTRGGPGDLVPWVDRLLELGMVGRAAHAASVSSRRLAAAGEAESARRWRRRAIMLGSDRGAASWPVVEGVGSLTQRELDIARLAAERARSREIAEQLGLSVRTIDNHLARVYRKLGVSGRDELREALV